MDGICLRDDFTRAGRCASVTRERCGCFGYVMVLLELVRVFPSLEGGVGVLSLSAVSKLVLALLNGPLILDILDGLQHKIQQFMQNSKCNT